MNKQQLRERVQPVVDKYHKKWCKVYNDPTHCSMSVCLNQIQQCEYDVNCGCDSYLKLWGADGRVSNTEYTGKDIVQMVKDLIRNELTQGANGE